MLLHVESMQSKVAQGYAEAVANNAADEFFLGALPLLMPLRLATPAPSANYEADLAELNQLSASLQQVSGQLAPIVEQYTDASQKLTQARAARRLLDAGVSIQPEAFGLGGATVELAQVAETETAAARDHLRHSLREVVAALNRRIQLGLSISLSDADKSGAPSGFWERVHELVTALNQAADDYVKHRETMNAVAVYDRVAAVTKSAGKTPALSQALEAQKKWSDRPWPSRRRKQKLLLPSLAFNWQEQSHLASSEIESLKQNSLRWFVDYRKMVDQLAEIAGAAGENIQVICRPARPSPGQSRSTRRHATQRPGRRISRRRF